MESSSEAAQPTSQYTNLGSTAAAPLDDQARTLLAAPVPVPDLLCGTALNPRQLTGPTVLVLDHLNNCPRRP